MKENLVPETENSNSDVISEAETVACDNQSEEYVATPIPGLKFTSNSENEMLYMEINNLREERDTLKCKLENTKSKFDSSLVFENDEKCKFYTGLCWTVFLKVFLFLNEGLKPARPGNISNENQFFITLVKLRQNIKFEYLADQVQVGKSTIIDMFWKWIGIIHSKLSFMIQWPDREIIFSTTPPQFKCLFPRMTNIIDCFEIFIETPKNLKARAQCYSQYKKHTTVKFLIACNPRGCVIFLSKAWGGRVSDNEITRKSGYISPLLHHPGDQILADRGFLLREDLATECSAELILPAFVKGKKQLPAEEVEKSRGLASVRILVERVIGLMKSRFSILQGILPLKLVKSVKSESENHKFSSADQIVGACAILTNLGEGIQI